MTDKTGKELLKEIASQFRDDIDKVTDKLKDVKEMRQRVSKLEERVKALEIQKNSYLKRENIVQELKESTSVVTESDLQDAYIPKRWFRWLGGLIFLAISILGLVVSYLQFVD